MSTESASPRSRPGSSSVVMVASVLLMASACASAPWRRDRAPEPPAESPAATGPTELDLTTQSHRAGALTMATDFYPDPYTIEGTSGGSVDASYLAAVGGPPCKGWTEAVPNHRLTLESDFESFSLSIHADGDTTLLMYGPDGWRCADDTNGLNPRIYGSLPAGTYRIWVGTDGGAEPQSYQLAFSQTPSEDDADATGQASSGLPPDDLEPEPAPGDSELDTETRTSLFEPVGLTAGFRPDPVTVDGWSGGSVPVDAIGYTPAGRCTGYADSEPGHVLTLHTPFDYLSLVAESEGQVSLVVNGPQGWLCSAGSEGGGAMVEGSFQPGTYRIWVADLQWGGESAYRLSFSESGQRTGSAPGAELDLGAYGARFQTLTIAPGTWHDPQALTGEAGGSVDVGYVGYTPTGPCAGYTEPVANHTLTLYEPMDGLRLEVQSRGDTALVIYGPEGWRCIDDVIGLNPAIEGRFSAGTYHVWVAEYAPGARDPYTLTVRSTHRGGYEGGGMGYEGGGMGYEGGGMGYDGGGMGYDGGGTGPLDVTSTTPGYGTLTVWPGFAPDPTAMRGMTVGDVSIHSLGGTPTGSCEGYTQQPPSHVIEVAGAMPQLEIEAVGDTDLTLAVHGPRGWLCSAGGYDDGPIVSTDAAPGTYRVWVGSQRPRSGTNYTLYVSSGSSTPPWPVGLDTDTWESRYAAITVQAGPSMPSQTVDGIASGSIDARYLGQSPSGQCVGYTEEAPNHLLTVNGMPGVLRIAVDSPGDTTLLVHGPNGWICNDDADGMQPAIETDLAPGTYRVWVGTYHEGDNQAYTLRVAGGTYRY